MKKIKIHKSSKLLIVFSFALLIALVIIDNCYYANNKGIVKENREKLKYTQIETMSMMSWVNNIEFTDEQLMDFSVKVDTTQSNNDTINKK